MFSLGMLGCLEITFFLMLETAGQQKLMIFLMKRLKSVFATSPFIALPVLGKKKSNFLNVSINFLF